MQTFKSLEALAAQPYRSDVDTDALIPKQFLKLTFRIGFGTLLFDDWRYLDRGELGQDCNKRPYNPNFVLNQPRYAGCQILLTRANFGCDSSREHAAWALAEYGFRTIITSSLVDIFYGNYLKNGLLPVVLDASEIGNEFNAVQTIPNHRMQVGFATQTLAEGRDSIFHTDIDPHRKQGLDDIELTLQAAQQIRSYEQVRLS
jgi:3-isopropylmalate/(R)-2-methylmalate dehydratase small subunit